MHMRIFLAAAARAHTCKCHLCIPQKVNLYKKYIFFSIYFQLAKRGMHQLVLQDVTLDSSGRYKCQITESKPPFHTEERERNLTVISKLLAANSYYRLRPNARDDDKCPSPVESSHLTFLSVLSFFHVKGGAKETHNISNNTRAQINNRCVRVWFSNFS